MAKRTRKPVTTTPKTTGRSKALAKKPPSTAVRPSKAPARTVANTIYQVKITLDHVRPPIWRRLLVKDCTLARLHDLIQISMGWEDDHLHEFEFGNQRYGSHEQWQVGPMGDPDVQDERKLQLSQLVNQGVKKFRYVYDMGDGWQHTIHIEKTLSAEAGVRYPRCVGGERACPPEDCGGSWGYANFVAAIQDPTHESHEELLEWIGGEFDPEAFDAEAVNEELFGLK
jgi:Plasmid pRiA4b ORF-3-like protein